jgi:chaperonin GroEL
MVTNQDRRETVLESPYILITDKEIQLTGDLLPVLEQATRSGGPLLVIAHDVRDEALAALVGATRRGDLVAAAVRAPGFGNRRRRMLEDIAILTGGEVITGEMGLRLETTQLSQLGRARHVVSDPFRTTIADGAGDPEQIRGRIVQIRREIETTNSDFDREKLHDRLSKLAGGAAIVKVGAVTESEMQDRKHRVERALQAARAALEEGLVPGGGVALLRAGALVDVDALEDVDERTGARIVLRALEEPLRQIAENSGLESSAIVNHVRNTSAGQGLNAATGEIEDLVAIGVIDPGMVTRSALLNAASIAKNIASAQTIGEPRDT